MSRIRDALAAWVDGHYAYCPIPAAELLDYITELEAAHALLSRASSALRNITEDSTGKTGAEMMREITQTAKAIDAAIAAKEKK